MAYLGFVLGALPKPQISPLPPPGDRMIFSHTRDLQLSHLEASGRSPTSVREGSEQCEDSSVNMQWKVSSVGSEREWTQSIIFKTEGTPDAL